MRKLALGNPISPSDVNWAIRSLKAIEAASFEDIEATMDDFTITGTFTETRELDVSTAVLADLIAFVATMVSDIQKRGQHRTAGE
jgi:hypothetical protein